MTTNSEWRDIETAPKDGTEFQAWVRNIEADEGGFWEPRARYHPEHGGFEVWGRVDYDQDGWDQISFLAPVKWMPHPQPPEKSA